MRATPIPDLKQTATRIFRETLAAIDIPAAMARKLDRAGSQICFNGVWVDLGAFERIFAVAVGKASVGMARGLADLLSPEFHAQGILVSPTQAREVPLGFRQMVAGHPIPDARSLVAGQAILDLLAGVDRRTLVFFLLSGGGSTLAELPLDTGIALEDVQEMNRALVTCGAAIDEINAVRKHLSAIKGGRLAVAAGDAAKITLAVSDVPDGQESALASGPTLPDPTTVADACDVVRRYELLVKFPPSVRTRFEHPDSIPETPKQGHPAFSPGRCAFQVILGLHDLTHPAHRAAEAAGFVTACDNSTDNWPVERATDFLLARLAAFRQGAGKPVAIIADGEVSSPVTGAGVGGRNQAFVLDCVRQIAGRRIAVLSAGTDGVDGSSPAAGAVADGETLARAESVGLDPSDFFRRSDSYSFFRRLGDAVETGPTGNNLRDLRVLLAE